MLTVFDRRRVLRNLGLAVCALSCAAAAQNATFFGSIWKNGTTRDPLFGRLFSQVTPENAGKWGVAEPAPGQFVWDTLDAMYRAAEELPLATRQHTFVWAGQQPSWVTAANAAVAVESWIAAYMARYGGKVDLIDVVNEPLHAPPPYRAGLGGAGVTGWDWVIWSFRKARTHAPGAKLLINDYDVLKFDGTLNRYVALCQLLAGLGLLDGIGVQGHFLEGVPAADLQRRLDILAGVGLPIYVSEYDVNHRDDAAQLAIYQAQFPVLWQHPAVAGVTLWGHREGQTWRPNAYLIRTGGTPRPAYTWLNGYLAANPPRSFFEDPANQSVFFADGTLGSLEEAWTPGAGYSITPSGRLVFENGELFRAGRQDYTDLHAVVRAVLPPSAAGSTLSLAFHAPTGETLLPSSPRVTLTPTEDGGSYHLSLYPRGGWMPLARVCVPVLTPGTVFTLRLSVTGDRVRAWVQTLSGARATRPDLDYTGPEIVGVGELRLHAGYAVPPSARDRKTEVDYLLVREAGTVADVSHDADGTVWLSFVDDGSLWSSFLTALPTLSLRIDGVTLPAPAVLSAITAVEGFGVSDHLAFSVGAPGQLAGAHVVLTYGSEVEGTRVTGR